MKDNESQRRLQQDMDEVSESEKEEKDEEKEEEEFNILIQESSDESENEVLK